MGVRGLGGYKFMFSLRPNSEPNQNSKLRTRVGESGRGFMVLFGVCVVWVIVGWGVGGGGGERESASYDPLSPLLGLKPHSCHNFCPSPPPSPSNPLPSLPLPFSLRSSRSSFFSPPCAILGRLRWMEEEDAPSLPNHLRGRPHHFHPHATRLHRAVGC
jgi:hypothetical protein